MEQVGPQMLLCVCSVFLSAQSFDLGSSVQSLPSAVRCIRTHT